MATTETLFDVVAVLIEKPHTVRIFERGVDEDEADAVKKFAVIRRGVDVEFYASTRPGMYKEGDEWCGNGLND